MYYLQNKHIVIANLDHSRHVRVILLYSKNLVLKARLEVLGSSMKWNDIIAVSIQLSA